MKRLNEAWEVLGNADRRRRYDQACVNTSDQAQQAAAAQDVKDAAAQAANYPPKWSDFANAEYGTYESFGVTFATIKNSYSGIAFTLIGALLGIGLGIVLVATLAFFLVSTFKDSIARHSAMIGRLLLGIVFLCAAGGSWVASWLHQALRERASRPKAGESTKKETKRASDEAAGREAIRCPSCKRKLRIPSHYAELSVRCPACSHQFAYDKKAKFKAKSMALLLRILVTAHIIGTLLRIFLPSTGQLPPELQAWADVELQKQNAAFDAGGPEIIVLAILILSLLGAYIASCVGLYLLRGWGLWTFATITLLLLFANLLSDPVILSGHEAFLGEVVTVIGAAIITVGFCTEAISAR